MNRLIKILAILVVMCVTTLTAEANVHVRGYYRRNGTYVQPHWRSNPDGNFHNNWSTYPNINPYTGAVGTRRTPSHSGSYFWRTPSYDYSGPSYWNGYSQSFPSYSSPRYDILGGSR